jgi:hypothetical protein
MLADQGMDIERDGQGQKRIADCVAAISLPLYNRIMGKYHRFACCPSNGGSFFRRANLSLDVCKRQNLKCFSSAAEASSAHLIP